MAKKASKVRTITLTAADIRSRWDALFNANPWLEGLSADSTCGDVFCCPPDSRNIDWLVLSEVGELLFLSGANTGSTPMLTRDMVPFGNPSDTLEQAGNIVTLEITERDRDILVDALTYIAGGPEGGGGSISLPEVERVLYLLDPDRPRPKTRRGKK